MCGIVGALAHRDVSSILLEGLYRLPDLHPFVDSRLDPPQPLHLVLGVQAVASVRPA